MCFWFFTCFRSTDNLDTSYPSSFLFRALFRKVIFMNHILKMLNEQQRILFQWSKKQIPTGFTTAARELNKEWLCYQFSKHWNLFLSVFRQVSLAVNLQLFHSQRECCFSTSFRGVFVAFPLLSPSFQPYLKLEMNLNCDVKLCNLISWRRLNCVNKKNPKQTRLKLGESWGGRRSSSHTTSLRKRQSWAEFSFWVYKSTSKHAIFY